MESNEGTGSGKENASPPKSVGVFGGFPGTNWNVSVSGAALAVFHQINVKVLAIANRMRKNKGIMLFFSFILLVWSWIMARAWILSSYRLPVTDLIGILLFLVWIGLAWCLLSGIYVTYIKRRTFSQQMLEKQMSMIYPEETSDASKSTINNVREFFIALGCGLLILLAFLVLSCISNREQSDTIKLAIRFVSIGFVSAVYIFLLFRSFNVNSNVLRLLTASLFISGIYISFSQ